MKTVNFLWVSLFVIAFILSCEEKHESFSGPELQDSLASVRVYPAPPAREAAVTGVNLALQGTASAQSTFSGYSPARINDGSNNVTVGGAYS